MGGRIGIGIPGRINRNPHNAICPGYVLTPWGRQWIDARAAADKVSASETARALLSGKHPSNAFTTPEQVGGLAVFLCSSAADNLTGASLPVDGGWTSQ